MTTEEDILNELQPPERTTLAVVAKETVAALKHWGFTAECPAGGTPVVFVTTHGDNPQTFKLTIEEV